MPCGSRPPHRKALGLLRVNMFSHHFRFNGYLEFSTYRVSQKEEVIGRDQSLQLIGYRQGYTPFDVLVIRSVVVSLRMCRLISSLTLFWLGVGVL